jgi:C4-dicarboxylate-specific signal transduction histidine kinase
MKFAAKAMNAAEACGNVTLGIYVSGAERFLRVVDDGPAVLLELSERVFDPFFTTGPVGQGAVRGRSPHVIARMYRGSLEIGDVPGGGGCISSRIPNGFQEAP